MSFEKLVLLIIAFNVISGLIARRAKKKKAEEAARRADAAPGSPERAGTRPVPPRRARDPEPSREDDGEHDEGWDEHHVRGGEGRARPEGSERDENVSWAEREEGKHPNKWSQDGNKQATRNIPAESDRGPENSRDRKPGPIPSQAKEKAAEIGKDLLSQLAKELGLEFPRPEDRRPRPVPAPPQPPPAKQSAPAKTAPAKPASKSLGLAAGKAKPPDPARRSPQPVAPVPAIEVKAPPLQKELLDVEAVRRAFVLKTILDPPLSLRRREP